MRSINNFSKAICKASIKLFNIIPDALRRCDKVSNQIKGTLTYASFKLHTKAEHLKLYSQCWFIAFI